MADLTLNFPNLRLRDINYSREYKSNKRTINVLVHSGAAERSDLSAILGPSFRACSGVNQTSQRTQCCPLPKSSFMIFTKISATAENATATREQETFLYTAVPQSATTAGDRAAAPSSILAALLFVLICTKISVTAESTKQRENYPQKKASTLIE